MQDEFDCHETDDLVGQVLYDEAMPGSDDAAYAQYDYPEALPEAVAEEPVPAAVRLLQAHKPLVALAVIALGLCFFWNRRGGAEQRALVQAMKGKPPIWEKRYDRGVYGKLWLQEGRNGPFLKAEIGCTHKANGAFRNTNRFTADQLPSVAKAVQDSEKMMQELSKKLELTKNEPRARTNGTLDDAVKAARQQLTPREQAPVAAKSVPRRGKSVKS